VRLLAVWVDWQAVKKATVSRQAAILMIILLELRSAFRRVTPDGLYNYYILIGIGKKDFCKPRLIFARRTFFLGKPAQNRP
jgi:hypothetical protein